MKELFNMKIGKVQISLFILQICAQRRDVFPGFYLFYIAVWNALLSPATKG